MKKFILGIIILLSSLSVYASSHKAIIALKIEKAKPLFDLRKDNAYAKTYREDIARSKKKLEKINKKINMSKTKQQKEEAFEEMYQTQLDLAAAESRLKKYLDEIDEKSWEIYPEYQSEINKIISSKFDELLELFPESEMLEVIKGGKGKYAHYSVFISTSLMFDNAPNPPIGTVYFSLVNNKTNIVLMS